MSERRDARSGPRYQMASRRPPERRPADRRRGGPDRAAGGIPVGVVILAVAVVLSVAYAAYAVTVRDTSQIPLLASGAVVVGIAFGALALYVLSATWRAGIEGRGGQAILFGFLGGIAAIIAAGCAAAAIVLFMLAGST